LCSFFFFLRWPQAGTVEFLVDSSSGEYFFCEMNTRLQVEHPVTEMVTGLDLVEWQLLVAGGAPLPILDQQEVDDRLRRPQAGHAIEARVYAETPLGGFLPATGTITRLREPPNPRQGGGAATVRVDTGVRQGDDVTMFYDPMVSKLIVHALDRPAALKAMAKALSQYHVSGLPTNLGFLKRCVEHQAFQKGGVTTAFLDDFGEAILAAERAPPPMLARAVAALALTLHKSAAPTKADPVTFFPPADRRPRVTFSKRLPSPPPPLSSFPHKKRRIRLRAARVGVCSAGRRRRLTWWT